MKVATFQNPGIVNKIVASCGVILSIGWIIGAAYSHKEKYGGLGGAIAVALSFFLLFVGGGIGKEVYDIITEANDATDAKLNAIIKWIEIDAASTNSQKIYLACLSIIGTIACGFGEIVAEHISSWLWPINSM